MSGGELRGFGLLIVRGGTRRKGRQGARAVVKRLGHPHPLDGQRWSSDKASAHQCERDDSHNKRPPEENPSNIFLQRFLDVHLSHSRSPPSLDVLFCKNAKARPASSAIAQKIEYAATPNG